MKEKLESLKRLIQELIDSIPEESSVPAVEEKSKTFDELKRLLESDEWPEAVFQIQIADENSESDKEERAEGITDMILPPLDGKKFLDFGCGEGHIVNCTSKSAEMSVGYDIVKNPKSRFEWEAEKEKILLTTDLEKARSKGPYDVILLYDVLDHAQVQTPGEILKLVCSLLSDEGKVYLRTHPWTSRHGGHAYRKLNKAFVHLVFTEEELKSMDIELEPNMKVNFPISSYNSWIKDSGLIKSMEPELDEQEVEPFFSKKTIVKDRILKLFEAEEWKQECPVWQMSQCFWDYVLEKEKK